MSKAQTVIYWLDRMILLLSDKKSSLFALLVSVYNTAKKFLGYKLLSVILLFYLFLTGPH